ncbi:hypothetical protein CR513_52733, partial [Mucuna pruriens]
MKLTPSRPGQVKQPISSIKKWPSSTFHVNRPTQKPPQIQLNCHVTLGVACNSSHARVLQLHSLVWGGGCKSEIEKSKSVNEGCLGFHHSLVDLILKAQANGGEPPPSTMMTKNELIKLAPLPGIQVLLCFVCQVKVKLNPESVKSSTDPLYALDHEIEITLCRLRKTRNIVVNINSNSDSVIYSDQFSIDISASSSNIFAEPRQMENNDRTLKELAIPDVLEPTQTYELKSGLIHLLPKFHGLAREDPHKHLKEFHVVCSTMRPQGIPEDYIKMKAFPFSLDRATKDWLTFQHLGRHEAHISGEVLSGIQNCVHQEGNLWDKAAY